jgi:hypothetical protein
VRAAVAKAWAGRGLLLAHVDLRRTEICFDSMD